jgi:mRNA interferase YafQ
MYRDCEECHITPDWLLIYKVHDNNLILLLFATGSHSDLFK